MKIGLMYAVGFFVLCALVVGSYIHFGLVTIKNRAMPENPVPKPAEKTEVSEPVQVHEVK